MSNIECVNYEVVKVISDFTVMKNDNIFADAGCFCL